MIEKEGYRTIVIEEPDYDWNDTRVLLVPNGLDLDSLADEHFKTELQWRREKDAIYATYTDFHEAGGKLDDMPQELRDKQEQMWEDMVVVPAFSDFLLERGCMYSGIEYYTYDKYKRLEVIENV